MRPKRIVLKFSRKSSNPDEWTVDLKFRFRIPKIRKDTPEKIPWEELIRRIQKAEVEYNDKKTKLMQSKLYDMIFQSVLDLRPEELREVEPMDFHESISGVFDEEITQLRKVSWEEIKWNLFPHQDRQVRAMTDDGDSNQSIRQMDFSLVTYYRKVLARAKLIRIKDVFVGPLGRVWFLCIFKKKFRREVIVPYIFMKTFYPRQLLEDIETNLKIYYKS